MGCAHRVLIVIPAWNEARNLSLVIREIREAGPWDIVVVDDRSQDQTIRIADEEGVTVLRLPINLGIGGAVQTGYKYALENGYDVVIQVDADGQHVPTSIPDLLLPIIERRADLVVGSRFIPERFTSGTTWARRIGIFFFSMASRALGDLRVEDVTSGFRAANLASILRWASDYPTDFPDAPALLMLHLAGLTVEEIPARFRERLSGVSSTTPLRSVIYPFKGLVSLLAVLLNRAFPPGRRGGGGL